MKKLLSKFKGFEWRIWTVMKNHGEHNGLPLKINRKTKETFVVLPDDDVSKYQLTINKIVGSDREKYATAIMFNETKKHYLARTDLYDLTLTTMFKDRIGINKD